MIIEINPYDEKSIANALKEVNRYKKSIATKEAKMLKKLAKFGCTRVKGYFALATIEDGSTIEVTFSAEGNRATIIANGEQVAFVEFGAGVYYNQGDTYPLPRPDGIVGIGEYGKGHGKRKAWGYYKDGDKSQLVITHGIKSAKAMYKGIVDITEIITETAREVFKS